MLKKIISVVVILVVVVLVVLAIVINRLDPIVKTAMESVGPKMLGAPVTVEKVDFSVLRMRFELDNLVVGNPEGYNTDNAISVGKVLLKVRPLSLFTSKIHVEQVLVEDPAITYEVGLGNSNIGTLLENVNKFTSKDGEKEEEPKEEEKPEEGGKKVVIDEVTVSGGKVRLSAKILQGVAAPIPLPTISLHDIGKEKDGASMIEATAETLKGIFTGIVDCGKQGVSALGDGVKDVSKAIGDGAKDLGKAIGDNAGKAVDAVKGIFGSKK